MGKYSINPWLEIQNMREEITKMMDEALNWGQKRNKPGEGVVLWQPLADVYETQENFVIEMELPGIDREKINLEVKGQQLLVYGERRLERDATGSVYQILERSYGPFARNFFLRGNVHTSGIKAVLKNGVLTITIPKRKSIQPSGIRIDIT